MTTQSLERVQLLKQSETLKHNLKLIHERIQIAAQKAGRDPQSIKLIAVSKFHTQDEVRAAMALEQTVFGENRVQEAKGKFLPLRDAMSFELHLIGPLQTNKAEEAVSLFDVIQTIDRPSLAKALAKAIQKTGRTPRLSIEVNSGQETQKAGIAPEELSSFLAFCKKECGLEISGLMCIPPVNQPARPFFRHLKEMAQDHDIPNLSMGMSHDFEEAILEGATEIRVGTALFGPRRTE